MEAFRYIYGDKTYTFVDILRLEREGEKNLTNTYPNFSRQQLMSVNLYCRNLAEDIGVNRFHVELFQTVKFEFYFISDDEALPVRLLVDYSDIGL
jgi:hypothetical protein